MPNSSKAARRARIINIAANKDVRLLYFLVAVLAIHGLFLVKQFRISFQNFVICWPLNIEQRRHLMLPHLYSDVCAVNVIVPADATLWYVGPYMPHYVLYYIYPRKIMWGSPRLSDASRIHDEHPGDWILSDETFNNPMDHIHLNPPKKS